MDDVSKIRWAFAFGDEGVKGKENWRREKK